MTNLRGLGNNSSGQLMNVYYNVGKVIFSATLDKFEDVWSMFIKTINPVITAPETRLGFENMVVSNILHVE